MSTAFKNVHSLGPILSTRRAGHRLPHGVGRQLPFVDTLGKTRSDQRDEAALADDRETCQLSMGGHPIVTASTTGMVASPLGPSAS